MTQAAVPVFLYHSVQVNPPPWIAPFTVPPRTFAEQLDLLTDSGHVVVPLRQLVAALYGGPPLPPRSAVLTFDDGFADFHTTVAPLLADRGLPATLYVTTGALRGPGPSVRESLFPPAAMLTWRQVGQLDALGIEIGGHTRTHPQLDTLTRRGAQEEIEGCKHQLQDALGHPVHSFAFPHGYSCRTVRRQVREAGWSSAAAVRCAFSSGGDDPLRIARLMVRADTDRKQFRAWIRGAGAPVAPFADGVRTPTWRAYRRLRAGIGRPYAALPGRSGA
ncbi:polysaccharide deacetylase family protein [Streptomyces sp. NPDC006365]|uniref:polysaccharide deacetylase family protein n=1 Tax=Streptomyces sp. NPDC006365 TaxID=3364744 RepID=UPI00368396DA